MLLYGIIRIFFLWKGISKYSIFGRLNFFEPVVLMGEFQNERFLMNFFGLKINLNMLIVLMSGMERRPTSKICKFRLKRNVSSAKHPRELTEWEFVFLNFIRTKRFAEYEYKLWKFMKYIFKFYFHWNYFHNKALPDIFIEIL